MQVILANPRGFCAGVKRAIAIVERVIEKFGPPVYVRHEVVHNRHVCDNLRALGAIFVDELDEVPDACTVIFSAHGVSKAVRDEARRRGLTVFDATCPLVTRVHLQVARLHRNSKEIIMIGHKGHPEVEGTMGQCETGMILVETLEDVEKLHVMNPEKLAYVTQTTLSVEDAGQIVMALRERFPKIDCPKRDDVCYATQNRQDAVKKLASQVDLMLVVGSVSSSNSNRLREVAEKLGIRAYLIDCASEIQHDWLLGVKSVGVTAGASAPEVIVEKVVDYLTRGHSEQILEMAWTDENIVFALPEGLI